MMQLSAWLGLFRGQRLKTWHNWLPMAGQKPIGIWREPREWIDELWRRRRAVLWDEGIASGVHRQILSGQDVIATPAHTWKRLPTASARCTLFDCKHRREDETMAYKDEESGDVLWLCLCGNTGLRFGTPLVDSEGNQWGGFSTTVDLPASGQAEINREQDGP